MAQTKGFTKEHLTTKLFKDILKGIDKQASLKRWSSINETKEIGYLTDMVEGEDDRILGLHPFLLEYTVPNTEEVLKIKVMIKSKFTSKEMYASVRKCIPESEKELLELFDKHVHVMEFSNLEYRELGCVQLDDETVKSIMPKIYWSQMDPDRNIFAFAMEYLENEAMLHLNSIKDIHQWQENDIESTLDGIALFHSRFYEQIDDIPASLRKYADISYKSRISNLAPLSKKFLERNFKLGTFSRQQFELGNLIIHNLPEICDILDSAPKTFIHNDMNVMNQCLRKNTLPGHPRLCAFDWELCYVGAPQDDTAFFLILVLPEDTSVDKWHYYLSKYYSFLLKYLHKRNCQIHEINIRLPTFVDFQKVFDMCICVRYINRFNWGGATLVPMADVEFFFPRIVKNAADYLNSVLGKYNFV